MTSSGRWQLKIDLVAYDGEESYEQYMDFQIGQSIGYRLNVGNYIGTAGDSLTRHSGSEFSTEDKDQDGDSSQHCSLERTGAWWFKDCSSSNLNSFLFGNSESREYKMMYWQTFKGGETALKATIMKMRPM